MDFDHEMNLLIQKYLKEAKNEYLDISEIEKRPRWKRVWFWWKAREHFFGKPMPEFTIEEVKMYYGE